MCYDYRWMVSDSMKILFIATVTEHINAFLLPYLKWLKEQGWEVHVATHCDGDILYCDKKHNISIERSPFKFGNLKAYFELKSILKKEKFDILHGHTPMGGMLARLCGKKYRKNRAFYTKNNNNADVTKTPYTRILYTAHGFHFYKGAPLINWLVYYPVEKLLSKYTDDLITINREDYDLAKRKMKAKITHYVPGVGVDVSKFSACNTLNDTCEICGSNISADTPSEFLKLTKRRNLNIPENATVLISVGELNKNKNHSVVIRALAKLKSECNNNCVSNGDIGNNIDNDGGFNAANLYYVVCGKGVLQENLKSLAKSLDLQNNVLLLGQRTDIAELLHMSDIFIFPSLREGRPVSIMEAMASGLPCIVSNIRGNVDLIEHEKGGLLCNAGKANETTASSTVSGYANAIKTLVADVDLRQSLGEYNKKAVKQFDIDVVMKLMQEIYLQSH